MPSCTRSSSSRARPSRRASATRSPGRRARTSPSRSSRRITRRMAVRTRQRRSRRRASSISSSTLKSTPTRTRTPPRTRMTNRMLKNWNYSTRSLRPSTKISSPSHWNTTWESSRPWETTETWKVLRKRTRRRMRLPRRNPTNLNDCNSCICLPLSYNIILSHPTAFYKLHYIFK